MPPPIGPTTRSGGSPKTIAVNGSRKRKDQTKTRRAAGARRGTRPVPPGSAVDTTGDSSDDTFIHLSRLAKELRDAAADHPGAQSALLDFLVEHWGQPPQRATPTRNLEDPLRSTPTTGESYSEDNDVPFASGHSDTERIVLQALQYLLCARSGLPKRLPEDLQANAAHVYAAMQFSLATAPSGFYGLIVTMETLQAHLRQLFDQSTKSGKTRYRTAQSYLCELYTDIKQLLTFAKSRLGSERVVELLYNRYIDKVRSADIDYFDPLELLRSSVDQLTDAHELKIAKINVAALAQQALVSPAPSFGSVHSRLPPPPPGLGIPGTSKHFFRNIQKKGRFPMNRDACVLCGKGEEPGSQGHRAEDCHASALEVNNWVEHAIPVK